MTIDISPILQRAIAILDCFSQEQPELGVREVSRRASLSPSAAGRLMQSLASLGLLHQNPDTRAYSLGARSLTWAGVYTATLDVRRLALPFIHELHRTTNETISLYIREGAERVCVERLESDQNVRIVARLGRRLPLHAGSAGKLLLAFLPLAEQEHIITNLPLTAFTPSTFTDPTVLRRELAHIRTCGYAVSRGEWLADAAGVAAPIFDQAGAPAAALTISGPIQRFNDAAISVHSARLLRVILSISRLLGFTDTLPFPSQPQPEQP